jgi:hypothetical protein
LLGLAKNRSRRTRSTTKIFIGAKAALLTCPQHMLNLLGIDPDQLSHLAQLHAEFQPRPNAGKLRI